MTCQRRLFRHGRSGIRCEEECGHAKSAAIFRGAAHQDASLGELRRFAQKFGVSALIDDGSKSYLDRGLRNARMSDDRWLELLAGEPLILKMPLVRQQNRLSIGLAEADWASWVSAT